MNKLEVTITGLLLACGGACSSVDPRVPGDGRDEVASLRADRSLELDLLFVIDNSVAMQPKQAALVAGVPALLDVLATVEGGLPSLHVGVASSDMGTSSSGGSPAPAIGQLGNAGCSGVGAAGMLQTNGAPVTGTFLRDERVAAGRDRNYTGELASVLAGMIELGETGCGFEQHLAAMRAALEAPGFRRPDASLAVVILADEDDCSSANPQLFGPSSSTLGTLSSYRCFREGVVCDPNDPESTGEKTGCRPREGSSIVEGVEAFGDALLSEVDERMLTLGILAGPASSVVVETYTLPGSGAVELRLAPSCGDPATDQSAVPAVRLGALVERLGERASHHPVCNADLGSALTTLGAAMKRSLGDGCLTRRIADTSPEPGRQIDCVVVDTHGTTELELPRCGGVTGDCWELVEDAARCPDLQHLELVVTREGPAEPGVWTTARCRTVD